MISVREDEFAAQAMGVNVARIKVLAFMIAAFFAGMAGGLYAPPKRQHDQPRAAGFQRSFNYVLMTVLGGRGSITGVMLAAIILTILPEVLRDFDQYRLIVYALLLIGMMLLRPQGLFGIHEIWDWRPKWFAACANTASRGGDTMSQLVDASHPQPPAPSPQLPARRRRHRHFVRRPESRAAVFDPLAARRTCTDSSAQTAPAKRPSSICSPAFIKRWAAESMLDSKSLVGLKPHQVAAAGIARTFQNIRLFPGLNVLDNVRLAGQLRAREGLATTLLRTRRYAREEAEIQRKAFELLGLFDLQDRAFEPADCLSYGHQRHLEIVRALAAEPKVLAARRAGRRFELARENRVGQVDSPDSRSIRRRDPADRARHGPRDGYLRADHRARSRRHHRSWHANRQFRTIRK